ncbi:spermidine/putrescine transport system substrate-binding protein [Humibacillus xanthopallidus]|uniref:Spermidine/putrescine transport system substrate-binding protein n=1 Tax=Humibacillus xanthopallidus TaxID=412689 RepID=A0A543PT05_9MICO|nr:spermidine/putrescine ABC transporter substrate-binding protein [Humibacillus xanthopallidus]TQN47207.1 spermidine/putrescine transport system substrate-binding protein [Humibacillus xanthopallidus]
MNDKSFDKDNPMLRAALMRGLVSRRSAMMGAAGVGAAAFLAACGSAGKNASTGGASGGAASRTAAAAQDMSDAEKVINWSNWTEYIDTSKDGKSRPSLDAFQKKTGIKVNYTEDYLDNDEFYAKVRPLLEGGKDTGRDVWCSTDWMVARLIRQGYVQKLDLANIPNAKNLSDSLKNVEFDPGRLYSLPWQSGFAGIGYNLKATGGKKIESITQLLTDPALKGKVTLLTEMRDTVGLVMMEQGKDISKFTDADFQAAIDVLQQAKDSGQILRFTGNEYTEGLAKGDIAACVAWTGDVVQLQFDDPNIQYALPEKGYTLWSDNFVIPALAKHKKNAEKLIDYYYDPAVMAEVVAFVNYISPVKGTAAELTKLDPALGKNPLIVPTEDVLSRAQVFRGLSTAEETKYNKLYSALTTA